MKISLILRALSGISSIPIDLVRMVDLTDRRAILPVYKPQSSDLRIGGVATCQELVSIFCFFQGKTGNLTQTSVSTFLPIHCPCLSSRRKRDGVEIKE